MSTIETRSLKLVMLLRANTLIDRIRFAIPEKTFQAFPEAVAIFTFSLFSSKVNVGASINQSWVYTYVR